MQKHTTMTLWKMKMTRLTPDPFWAEAASPVKMSQEDITVGAPAGEPHIHPSVQQ